MYMQYKTAVHRFYIRLTIKPPLYNHPGVQTLFVEGLTFN